MKGINDALSARAHCGQLELWNLWGRIICQVSGLSQQKRKGGYLPTNTHLLVEGFVLDLSHTWIE